jgi:hypothetical protein
VRRPVLATLLFLAAVVFLWPVSAHAAAPAPPPVIDAGGHLVEGPFRAFVLANGGLEVFGEPLSDAVPDAELGAPVQYFAFARLERHGERVLLTRLGSLAAHGREGEPPFQWVAPDAPLAPGRVYVPESGHTLGGAFAWYHRSRGGAAILGLPISEEFAEAQPDGRTLLVQYFERARLSYHPELAGTPGEIQRAPLGAWLAGLRLSPAQRAPGRPLALLGAGTISYPAGTALGANIELAVSRLDGATLEPGARLSFLAAVGEISRAAGYRPAPAIVGGKVVETVGGGVCAVSTLLYRAAWFAGLPVPERRGHSLWLALFADAPGLEAAVVAPGQDLRVANDTGQRIYVVATARGGRATLALWGRGDGRVTAVAAPLVRGDGPVEVVNSRTVRSAAGALLRRERVVTRYQLPPAEDEAEAGGS